MYLYFEINENNGLGKNWLIQELESSTVISGEEAIKLLKEGKVICKF